MNLFIKRANLYLAKKYVKRSVIFSVTLSAFCVSSLWANLDQVYTVSSAPTGELLGHAPGIRTAMTVDNAEGELRVCAKAKVHYQILDVDGDWDRPFIQENREGTQNSITWWLTLENGEKIQVDKRSLGIDPYSEKDQTIIRIPAYIKDAISGEIYPSIGGTLSYQIQPYTSLASSPDTSVHFLEVLDLTQAYYLKMAELPGHNQVTEVHAMPVDFLKLEVNVPNPNPLSPGILMPSLALNPDQSFITWAKILPHREGECNEDGSFMVTILDGQGQPIESNFKVDNHYIAQIELHGKKLRQEDLVDNQLAWKLFKPIDGSVCDIQKSEDRNNDACFVSETFTEEDTFKDGGNRVNHHFNELGELEYSEFFTQRDNTDASEKLSAIAPTYSEQGYFIGVSLMSK